MKKMIVVISVTFFCCVAGYGQLNDYKYIVVPAKFQSFKNENQFRTSTLVKYLFSNEGFNAVYSNNLPDDLKENPCLGLDVELVDESNLFATKTRLSLIDCNGVLVMMSQDGRTKTKEFEQAYREAISESFGSFRGLNYAYKPNDKKAKEKDGAVTVSFKNDVKSLNEKPKAEQNESTEGMAPEEAKPKIIAPIVETPIGSEKGVLYAQPIDGGYQLVDTTPKVVYILKSTSAPEVFLVNKDGKSGVIFKNDDKWFIEMDEKGGKAKELNIKF